MKPNEDTPSTDEALPPLGPEPVPTATPKTPEKEKPKPESRGRRFFRMSIRWIAGLLIVFSLGILATLFVFYIPARQEMDQAASSLNQARQQISELESKIEQQASLEEKNTELQAAVNETALHVVLLSARTDVSVAQMYLAKKDPMRARGALSKTMQTLEELDGLLEPDASQRAVDMRDRLSLAMKELDGDTFAAQSDLEVLSNDLLQLENTYFARP
jgi:hypothetical protein